MRKPSPLGINSLHLFTGPHSVRTYNRWRLFIPAGFGLSRYFIYRIDILPVPTLMFVCLKEELQTPEETRRTRTRKTRLLLCWVEWNRDLETLTMFCLTCISYIGFGILYYNESVVKNSLETKINIKIEINYLHNFLSAV